MKLRSLIQNNDHLVPAEVEVILLPGLPQIHVLGLPDQMIRESLHRVRGALRSQGFQWPKAKQILVNVRPVDQRKSSRGLELAIAAGIIWETGQASPPLFDSETYIYGELSLAGEVMEPEDLRTGFRALPCAKILTGVIGAGARPFISLRVPFLKDLDQPKTEPASEDFYRARRPPHGLDRFYTEEESTWLKLVALGEHHWLLAGKAGAGKSTLAKSLMSFLSAPSREELIKNNWPDLWRPCRAPHHSAGAKGLVGGGNENKPGEITRAHGGVLILDELLEYPANAQEALREPVETGYIDLSRSHRHARYPAKFIMIGTTNLCPCGRWVPQEPTRCSYSWKRCRSVVDRISGPFFDRFEGLSFVEQRQSERKISGHEILKRLEEARKFKTQRKRQNPLEVGTKAYERFTKQLSVPSERRLIALHRLIHTLADLDQVLTPEKKHFEQAYHLSIENFSRLSSGHQGI